MADKANAVKKQKISWQGPVCTVEYPTIGKRLTIDTSNLAEAVRDAARDHGFTQCYGDSASGGSPLEKFEMCQRRMDAHRNGSWELDTRVEDLGIVLEAVAREKKQSVKDIERALKLKYKTEDAVNARLKELRADPRVKSEIADIRAERAAKVAAEVQGEVEL